MKIQSISLFQKTASILWVVALLAFVTTAHATIQIIQFGGSLGDAYSPKSVDVAVGDTIRWEGSFSVHPLSSTSVPAGAQSFHQASGTVFDYPVAVAGTYLYQCDVHVGLGMTGSFTASVPTGIENNKISLRPGAFRLWQNFPNPFNPTTTISFDVPFQTRVSITVYNLLGEPVATLVDEILPAGRFSTVWNAASMPSGVYFYRLQSGSLTDTRKLVLLK